MMALNGNTKEFFYLWKVPLSYISSYLIERPTINHLYCVILLELCYLTDVHTGCNTRCNMTSIRQRRFLYRPALLGFINALG